MIAEDERYVVLEVTWKGGQKDNMHSHPKGLVVHFLTDCHARTVTRDGKVMENKRKAGETHPIEVVGRDLRTLMAWVKSHDDDYVEGTAQR